MVCERCCGSGREFPTAGSCASPCLECQGSGIVSCCDTAGAQAENPVFYDGNGLGLPVGDVDPRFLNSACGQPAAEENWQDWVNSQLAGTTRKDETALYARIVELEKRVGELERK